MSPPLPSSAGTGNWQNGTGQPSHIHSSSSSHADMIPTSSFYDPDNISDQAQQYHAQRYQEWIDSYSGGQQQQQQQQHVQHHQPTPTAAGFSSTSFSFVHRLADGQSQYDSLQQPYSQQNSGGYGYYAQPTQNSYPQQQQPGGHYYTIDQVAPASNHSSQSPTSWTGHTEDTIHNASHPNPTPSPTTSSQTHDQYSQLQDHAAPAPKRTVVHVTTTPAASNPSQNRIAGGNGGKRKRAARKSPGASTSAPDRHTLDQKRSRYNADFTDEDSEDEDGVFGGGGISVGVGGLTGANSHNNIGNGRKGKMVRL
ncbi:hypothetical protein VNI00_006096 [Paramarasmius palmivorus]|uniref:Uncharacterized protein n=1 Tax=Paramarasmius palmivorus TaxID=297713 RepID=A0AAW0D5H2_9AGAR